MLLYNSRLTTDTLGFNISAMSEATKVDVSKAAAALGRKGGQSKSDAKQRSARMNGMLGGRNPQLRAERLAWFEKMSSYPLSTMQRQRLQRWEANHLDGNGEARTSDWPGWEALIGKRPW